MRCFILFCVMVVATADTLGYNYQPVGHSDGDLSFLHGSTANGYNIGVSGGSAQLSEPIEHAHVVPAIEEFQKEFYSFSAPEEEFRDGYHAQQIANTLKANLRVIFIKGPENIGLERAALSLTKQASNEQTAIYVLSKQADISHLAHQLQDIKAHNSHKPEVHFVKYRTPQDAVNAQKAIQSQYDSLPGATRSSNEGTAPVLNFASKARRQPGPVLPGPDAEYLPAHPVPNQNYLPPISQNRFRL